MTQSNQITEVLKVQDLTTTVFTANSNFKKSPQIITFNKSVNAGILLEISSLVR